MFLKKRTKKEIVQFAKEVSAEIIHEILLLYEGNDTSIDIVGKIVNHEALTEFWDSEKVLQVERFSVCWSNLLSDVESNCFVVNIAKLCEYQGIIAKGEALEYGRFRTGFVGINGTSEWECVDSENLEKEFLEILNKLGEYKDILEKAIFLYVSLCDKQFFFDGNKRTAFCMMNGFLMSNGLFPIKISAKHKSLYDKLMIEYYETKNSKKINEFLKDCYFSLVNKLGKEGFYSNI